MRLHAATDGEVSKKFNISSRDFFLGNLAPDSVNIDGFAAKEERWSSHVRRKDRNEWREELRKFYEKEKDNYPKDFMLGYITHILTDIIHDDYLYLKLPFFPSRLLFYYCDYDCDNDKAHLILREDMEKYRFKEWNEIIIILESSNEFYDILNISKELEEKWLNKKVLEYLDDNKSIYQTDEDIKVLILLVSDALSSYL